MLHGQIQGAHRDLAVVLAVALPVDQPAERTDRPLVWRGWRSRLGIGPYSRSSRGRPESGADQGAGLDEHVTLFQQVGGTWWLSITGSLFGSVLLDEMPSRSRAGRAEELAGRSPRRRERWNNLSGVGDLGNRDLSRCPGSHEAVAPSSTRSHGHPQGFSIAHGRDLHGGHVSARGCPDRGGADAARPDRGLRGGRRSTLIAIDIRRGTIPVTAAGLLRSAGAPRAHSARAGEARRVPQATAWAVSRLA